MFKGLILTTLIDSVETNSDYTIGYYDDPNVSFRANIGDWMVPVIIIVLLVGGILSIMTIKKRRHNHD